MGKAKNSEPPVPLNLLACGSSPAQAPCSPMKSLVDLQFEEWIQLWSTANEVEMLQLP